MKDKITQINYLEKNQVLKWNESVVIPKNESNESTETKSIRQSNSLSSLISTSSSGATGSAASSDSVGALFGADLNLLNMLSRPDYFLWVDRISANQYFEVQVLPSGNASIANVTQYGIVGNFVAYFNQQLRHVGIQRFNAIGVAHHNRVAILRVVF